MTLITLNILDQETLDECEEIAEKTLGSPENPLIGTQEEKIKNWMISLVKHKINTYRQEKAQAQLNYTPVSEQDIN